jgi:hypothetical protein
MYGLVSILSIADGPTVRIFQGESGLSPDNRAGQPFVPAGAVERDGSPKRPAPRKKGDHFLRYASSAAPRPTAPIAATGQLPDFVVWAAAVGTVVGIAVVSTNCRVKPIGGTILTI